MNTDSPFTQFSVALSRSAQNFAPLKPLSDLLKNKQPNLKNPTRFEQSFREWYTAKLNYEKAARDEMISVANLVALFRRGQQILERRPYGQPGYYVRPIKDDNAYRQTAMNFMNFHSAVCESKIIASNPNVNMRAADDTPEAITAAQACRPVVDCYETEWYTARFSRREAIRLLTDGMFIHQVRWNPFKGGYSIGQRSVSYKDVQLDSGEGRCADCGHEGEAEEFEQADFGHKCQCGSEAVDVRPPRMQKLAQIGMGPQQPMGEPELISSPFAAWHWDLTRDLECSSWAIKRQYITQGVVNLMLGNVVIPDSQSSQDYGLEMMRSLAYSGQAFQGASRKGTYGYGRSVSDWEKRPTMFEAWLDADEQAVLECDEGETVCGITMPKGRVSDFFRGEPICVVGLNDGAAIVGTYAKESQKYEVITCQWFMDAESGAGRGMEDTAAVQKRFNAVDGQVYQGLATTATPPVFVDLRMLKEDQSQYLFKPGVNHDVNLSMLPVGMKLPDAIYMPQPGSVNQQYIAYGYQHLKQMADISSLAVEFSETLLSIDNRTATGAQITAALANSLYGPMLMSKGESRVSIAEKVVCLTAKHGVAGRYYPGKGAAQGRMVSGKDLKGKVIFELVQNSQLPVTPFSQQTDVRVFLETFGGAEMAATIRKSDPAFFRATSAPFNINFGNEDEDDVSNRCLERLEQMKQNLQTGVDDPQMLVDLLQPPVSVVEPQHKEKADWWSRYLDLDASQKAPQVLRQAAESMYWLHMNNAAQKQLPVAANEGLIQGVGAAAMQAPTALGASALQQQQPEPQVEDKLMEIEADVAMDQAKHESDLQMKQMESQTQLAVAKQQGANQLAATKLAGQNQLKVERAKPKPIVRKTA